MLKNQNLKKYAGKALIVDDESDIRNIMRYYLEYIGFEVEEADDGDVGIEKIKNKKYDYVFLDLKMPRMNGNMVLEKVRAMGIKDIKIIIVTGGLTTEHTKEEDQRVRELADEYIKKPFNLKILSSAIEKCQIN